VVEPDFVTTEIPEVGDALVIVYPLVSIVPLGAVKVIVAEDESIILAETPVGAFVIVVIDVDDPDATDVPPELVAVTVKV
jgi:hypothetical protein